MKIDRFWSHEASNIRCVREADYDHLAQECEQWHQLCAEAQVQRDQYQDQRDAALKQVEALKDVLAGAYAWMEDATSKVLYPTALHGPDRVAIEAEGLGSCTPDLFKSINAALQAKP